MVNKIILGCLVLVGFALLISGTAIAAPVPSTTDLWDMSQGHTTGVQASSVLKGWASDPQDMFGTNYSYLENGNFVFGGISDNSGSWPKGTIHEVYWQTNTPLAIGSFNLFAGTNKDVPGYPDYLRSFDHFNLSYFNAGTNSWTSLYDSDVALPYEGLVISAATSVIVPADSFRAQFRQYSEEPWASGPRVIELDGFAPAAVPEPATMALMGMGLAGLLRFRRKRI